MKPIPPSSNDARSPNLDQARLFGHFAMNTQFAIRFCRTERDPSDLLSVAQACFQEIDRLENLFSRYREDSEISQINQLQPRQSLIVNHDTYQIVKIAFELQQKSEGFFNITLGHYTDPKKLIPIPLLPSSEPTFSLHPTRPIIYCLKRGGSLDLGAIGKGYALDRCGELLLSLGVHAALLSAGNSTYLALGENPWEIVLQGSANYQKVALQKEALSASGTAIQGSHIINPHKPRHQPYFTENLWVKAKTATYADASSTLCMIASQTLIATLKVQKRYFKEIYIEDSPHKNLVRWH